MSVQSAKHHRPTPVLLSLGLILGSALLVPCMASQTPAPPPPPQPPQKPPTRVRTKLDGFDLSAKSGKSPNQVGGASRDIGTPKLFAPNSGKSFTTTPHFQWGAAEADAKVTFRLSTVDGQTVYETATTAGQLAYPDDAPALTPGSTYRWTVIPENDILGGAPAPVSFLIVSGAERDQIVNELKSANDKSRVDIFVKHRLWYDAIQGYSELIDRVPNDKSARAGRAEIYDQLPVTASLADADWRMAQ